MLENKLSTELRNTAKAFPKAKVAQTFEILADEFDRLETENQELRQKAENNQTCYICESTWAERVGQILLKEVGMNREEISGCAPIFIPVEVLDELLLQYKTLGHSMSVEEPGQ